MREKRLNSVFELIHFISFLISFVQVQVGIQISVLNIIDKLFFVFSFEICGYDFLNFISYFQTRERTEPVIIF